MREIRIGPSQLRAIGSRQCANSTRSSSRPSEARAGIHNHRRFDLIELERPSRLTMNAGGYGSLLSQGRRGRIHFQEPTSNARSRSRSAMRPSWCIYLSPLEGVGNAGCPLHPQPRAHFVLVKRTRVTTSTPESPGIPARNGFNGFLRALPGDRALLPPSFADTTCQNPAGPTCLRNLDASVGASGPHDFAVRSIVSRQRALRSLTDSKNPPCDPLARKTLPRPPHPIPTFVTMANAPLAGRDDKSSRCDLGCTKTEIFLQRGMDRQTTEQPVGQISRSIRRR